ncbi:MAG: TIGR03032 family protein [Bacteroidota bacterium]
MKPESSVNNNQRTAAPFACTYSPQVPALLHTLGCSIAISTYQAGKIVLISARNEQQLVQLPRTFNKPMGIAEQVQKGKLAVAIRDEVIVFANSPALATHYPKRPHTYDALYLPRMTYHTGPLDIHDLRFGEGDRLFAVNTLFSSIVQLDDDYNFTPYWTPPFIDKIVPEDYCHLNGMAMQDGKPKYASSFNQGNSRQSWRANITTGGTLFDIDSNEVIITGLAMPHSPRIFNGDLYVLLSATGELVKVDLNQGRYETIAAFGNFVRGMSLYQDYLFVGLSKIRKSSATFAKLDIAQQADQAGIAILHLPTGQLVGQITYLNSVEEIYDVHVLGNTIRPNILNTMTDDHKGALMIPQTTYWSRAKGEGDEGSKR